jgi:hypothetical protein
MTRRLLVALAIIALLLGATAGLLYRHWTQPTPEERAHRTVDQLKGAGEKATR